MTKGGNNNFHGQASYWHQSSSLAARDFFATRKPQLLFAERGVVFVAHRQPLSLWTPSEGDSIPVATCARARNSREVIVASLVPSSSAASA